VQLRNVATIYTVKKAGKAAGWELKPFTAKETGPWKAAVAAAQKQLKTRKREHPALFLLAAVGKQLYEAAQSLYEASNKKSTQAKAKAKPKAKAKAKVKGKAKAKRK